MAEIGKEQAAATDFRTVVGFNQYEVSWAEDVNVRGAFQVPRIVVIENFRRRERTRMDDSMGAAVRGEVAYWKRKHPEAEIVQFFQFKKGTRRSDEQLEAAQQAQQGADARCFYEKARTQDEVALQEQLESFAKRYLKGKQYVVLEVEGKNIAAKVATALGLGFKNFIFIGGVYWNPILWRQLTNTIRTQKGTSTGLLYTRMNTHSKESHIKFMVRVGVDFVVHGSPNGYGSPKEVLYLDENDLFFKPIGQIRDVEVQDAVQNTPSEMLYRLSRVLAIDDANTYAETHPAEPIVEE